LASLRKLRPLVSQAGCGPGYTSHITRSAERVPVTSRNINRFGSIS